MAYEIMYDDTVVAYKEENGFTYHLVQGIPKRCIPLGLFRDGNTEPATKVIEYFCDRVFPEERVDCERVLATLGLDHYDRWEIVKKNNATIMTDSWWMKINPTDNYYNNSCRGWAGYPPEEVKMETTPPLTGKESV